jgi:enamine deaminase RidA (YjgF/YER057c/UK114 family)
LKELLETADSSLDEVVKVNIFLGDVSNFADMIERAPARPPQPVPDASADGVGYTMVSLWIIAQPIVEIAPKG